MAILKNRAGVVTATAGTGTITLGAAIAAGVPPFSASWQSFAAAGVANSDSVRYLILDNNGAWEYGPGTYTTAGTTLSRAGGAMDGSVAGQKSSTGALLSLSGNAQVFITATAEDIPSTALLAPIASPTFTGDPKAPTPGAGDNDTSIATTAFVQAGFEKIHAIGQCYLNKSGANLLLSVWDGDKIMINGVVETIPGGGVTLVPTGNTANTFYYIYVFMSGGTMTLEFSTTGYTVGSGGVKTKSGDATRTLVGIASSGTSSSTWSSNNTEVVSYFNPKDKTIYSGSISNNTTSVSLVDITATLLRFISFADREVIFNIMGRVTGTVNTASLQLDIDQDGVAFLFTAITGTPLESRAAAASGEWFGMFGEVRNVVSDSARHSAVGMFANSTGTIFFVGGWSVTVRG